MAEKLRLPKFASEAEEASWWFDHSDEVTKAFEDAADQGKLGIGSVASLARRENRDVDPMPVTAILLDPDGISRAHALAAQHGLRYRTYLKVR